MLEYAEYKDVVDIIQRSNHDMTYQDLMQKETKVLDTINAVVKQYRDQNIKDIEFINRGITENISRFWLDMNLMLKELVDISSVTDVAKVLKKGERIIYFGLICMSIAAILFFVEISN